jgi:hypothetical protein
VGPIDGRRVVAGSVAVVALATGAVVAVRAVGDGGARSVLAFVLGLAVVPLIASPLEWIVHRFVYHAPALRPLATIFKVHTVHHHGYFPTWRYTTGGPARRLSVGSGLAEVHSSPVRNAGVRLAHFCWYMVIGVVVVWLPTWVITRSVPFLVGIVLSSIVVSNLFIVVHDTIHRPGSHRLVEAQPWFAFLDRHHWIHHIDLGANLNFLLPLADLLFGTLRTSATSEESAVHGTLAQAKARPLGQGERAALAVTR